MSLDEVAVVVVLVAAVPSVFVLLYRDAQPHAPERRSYRSPMRYLVDLSARHPVTATLGFASLAAMLGAGEGWRWSWGPRATAISAAAWAVIGGGFFGWKVWRSRRSAG